MKSKIKNILLGSVVAVILVLLPWIIFGAELQEFAMKSNGSTLIIVIGMLLFNRYVVTYLTIEITRSALA